MKRVILFIVVAAIGNFANSQGLFHSTVKVEFEKTVYVKQLIKALEPEWYDMVKDRVPDAAITYFDFVGDSTHSLYKPGREVRGNTENFFSGIADRNSVYNDYHSGTTITQKPCFEEVFLVQDSLLKIKWKLTADTRVIAGFECRKAVGFFDDSIAVFAFYTDEIMISGGPESAHGLPGMILGLGMPRIHTTWFATKVEINGVELNKVTPATKGKKVDRKTMLSSLDKVLKNWGDYGKNMVWNYVI